jgi:hypothetical protein
LSNPAGTTDTHCAISSDPTNKKKRITSSTGKRDDRHVISNLNSILAELADGVSPADPHVYATDVNSPTENHSTGRETATLFMALDHFAQLASLHELPDFPVDIFISATRRVIHAASDVLHSILETNRNLNKLELLHNLMRFVIETSFLHLPLSSESFGYLLFNQLSGLLLSPVIHSFFPLSITSLGYLLEPANTTGASQNDLDLHIDCRAKVLEFFQGIVSGLFSASCSLAKTTSGGSVCQDASSMRDILILETIRHLKGILSPIPVDSYNPGAPGDERNNPQAEDKVDSRGADLNTDFRARRLAVKDALWYLCSVTHVLIGSRAPGALSSTANSGHKLVEDSDYMQYAGSEILKKNISRELFELLIDANLSLHETSWLPSDTSQTATGITGTALKTVLLASDEARSHRNVIQYEQPIQEILTSNKQANCFESNHTIYTSPFDHIGYHDSKKFSKHGTEVVSGIVTEGNHMHHVLDDAERGMLLCVVERFVNTQ